MKKIIVILCVALWSLYSHADGLLVSSFTVDIKDLSARTKERVGRNGKNCALLKLSFPEESLSFEGNIVGSVKHIDSEYWIYMEEGADLLVVQNPNTDQLIIDFNEYKEIKRLESNVTYKVKLQTDKYDYQIKYSPTHDGEHNGFKYVDLGLSVKWAICNVGASSPSEEGKRYAFGETDTKNQYTMDNYKFKSNLENDDFHHMLPYMNYDDESVNLKATDDVARCKWGGEWRMPTIQELVELFNSCTFIWTSYNGTFGHVVTGPNGNSIFLPFVDVGENELGNNPLIQHQKNCHSVEFREIEDKYRHTTITKYRSSSEIRLAIGTDAFCLMLGQNISEISYGDPCNGYLVRPVLKK